MHYHIILTERCNLKCKYCYEKSLNEFDNGLDKKFKFDFTDPCISKVDIKKLKEFMNKDPEATIIFYGGEPLLQIEKIKEIIDNINVPFRMQTNGQLLHLLEPKYLNKITKILISIDGNKETTDKYRGQGTYQKLINNIKLMKQNGYQGELVARMTVAQDNPDIYKNVADILNLKSKEESCPSNTNHQKPTTNNRRIFNSVHWQLDVGFYKTDYEKNKISNFFKEYNKSISKLIAYWTDQIQKGNVIKIYPFIGIVESILKEEPTKLRCGAGEHGYTITTSGKIVACPIMNSIEDFKAGDLNTNPKDLKNFEMNECANCDILDLCGGRCMYWKKAGLWPEKGNDLICKSIKHYIKEIQLSMPKITEAIITGKVKQSDFDYEKYFGPEIIP